MSDNASTVASPSRRPWHLKTAAIYLLANGLWVWGMLCYAVIVDGMPLAPYAVSIAYGLLIAAACFAAAYALYRGRKAAIACIVAIPVLKWLAFAHLLPDQVGMSDSSLDLAYLRQLPPALLMNLAVFGAMALYALYLLKTRRLS